MSNSNTSRSGDTQMGALLKLDKAELKSIKVAIMRRNVIEPNASGPFLRSLEDPSQLIVHYRPDEGTRPIFEREDIVVNKENQEERMVLTSSQGNDKTLAHRVTSRSSSRSTRSSSRGPQKEDKKKLSPEAHTSRDRSKEEYRSGEYYSSRSRRSNSNSRKAVYKSNTPPRSSGYQSRRSKSPRRSPEAHKRRERSPRSTHERRRTPPRYYTKQRHSRSPSGYKRAPPERRTTRSPPKVPEKSVSRRRSRTPPPRRSSRGRSRSYSPHHRSRYSRSPYRREDRRERSRRSRSRRSRSPRRRYDEDRHERREEYEPPRIPNPYFEGAEFWIPPMLQHRFLPRQMIPPGPFPYPFRPGIPPMVPPRMPFRPRIVYNSRPPRPRSTPSTSAAIESTSVVTTTTTAGTSKDNETVTITECVEDSEQPSVKTE
ncbi:serine/arginine repetitive matrix protein 1-like isoform X1 [Zophobas morio]|uniref:serine/arginine repetitive matrix protein 1-like isoform X1 n=1 Tax=Zophobas morio TaxID=2755281 RepID=UPI0030830591